MITHVNKLEIIILNKLKNLLNNKYLALSAALLLSLSSLLILTSRGIGSKVSPQVLGESETVASVYGCLLDFRVQPEARVGGNYFTDVTVDIYDPTNTTNFGTFDTSIDANGFSTNNICEDPLVPIYMNYGFYNFFIKGRSHITKAYNNFESFEKVLSDLDFTSTGQVLIAGDTNSPRDDEINSLDITHLIRTLGSVDGIDIEYNNDYDLNNDNNIDQDDTDILINNFYEIGDPVI